MSLSISLPASQNKLKLTETYYPENKNVSPKYNFKWTKIAGLYTCLSYVIQINPNLNSLKITKRQKISPTNLFIFANKFFFNDMYFIWTWRKSSISKRKLKHSVTYTLRAFKYVPQCTSENFFLRALWPHCDYVQLQCGNRSGCTQSLLHAPILSNDKITHR